MGVPGVQSEVGRTTKRLFDILASTVGLAVLSPVFILIAIAIKLDSNGPVFFKQERVGFRGQLFRIWKFRTMNKGAAASGPEVTIASDKRITRVGAVLRNTKLDEIPQLINVIRGNMSLVGPRPETFGFVTNLSEDELEVLRFKPGITDPASIKFRNEASLLDQAGDPMAYYQNAVLPEKIRINLAYQEGATFFTDLSVIIRTLWSLVKN
jgi:lipopolysaccharide/colanic/teichoic acid biosynthesis glycosyltransferase|tara:strand:+ start:236 stop:865 length:630 start_codon:yes stop_codon:yes gene_type:complete